MPAERHVEQHGSDGVLRKELHARASKPAFPLPWTPQTIEVVIGHARLLADLLADVHGAIEQPRQVLGLALRLDLEAPGDDACRAMLLRDCRVAEPELEPLG